MGRWDEFGGAAGNATLGRERKFRGKKGTSRPERGEWPPAPPRVAIPTNPREGQALQCAIPRGWDGNQNRGGATGAIARQQTRFCFSPTLWHSAAVSPLRSLEMGDLAGPYGHSPPTFPIHAFWRDVKSPRDSTRDGFPCPDQMQVPTGSPGPWMQRCKPSNPLRTGHLGHS